MCLRGPDQSVSQDAVIVIHVTLSLVWGHGFDLVLACDNRVRVAPGWSCLIWWALFFSHELVFSSKIRRLGWTVDCILLLPFSVAVKRVGGDGEGMGASSLGNPPQCGKRWPVSLDGYCSIIYNENLKATLMFNYNRIRLSKFMAWWNILQSLTSFLL